MAELPVFSPSLHCHKSNVIFFMKKINLMMSPEEKPLRVQKAIENVPKTSGIAPGPS